MPAEKNIYLLGDSYSTFEGYIPKGNLSYYTSSTPNSDVRRYEDTWMYHLEKLSGSKIILNDSWSGSTICNTGYEGAVSSVSFIKRFERTLKAGFFSQNNIDRFLIMGGTNDSWANSPVGSIKFCDITDEDLLCVFPGMVHLIELLLSAAEREKILFIINKEEIKKEIYDGYKLILEKFKIPYMSIENIDRIEGHPTIAGMKAIAEAVAAEMK